MRGQRVHVLGVFSTIGTLHFGLIGVTVQIMPLLLSLDLLGGLSADSACVSGAVIIEEHVNDIGFIHPIGLVIIHVVLVGRINGIGFSGVDVGGVISASVPRVGG